ncbi:biotin-protein ligase [Parasitella parasitica]|nr:biotin-protein ligase [Parasitella parasitica]
MNILIYNDLGASPNSVKQAYNSLKKILGHVYDIIQIDRRVLQSEPWEEGCVMLVMPGGRDLPYCEALNGEPNARIRAFVQQGGRYLGLCAGAYYASASIEFEKGRALMEIIQPRELGFYPGLCRGTMYPGFVYNSESGARSVAVNLDRDILSPYYDGDDVPVEINMYYNGGGYFVLPEKHDNVTVLCRYKEPGSLRENTGSQPAAAVVHCKVGRGHALLIAAHPEYDISSQDLLLADEGAVGQSMKNMLCDLSLSEIERKRFLHAAFALIGLDVVPVADIIVQENKIPNVAPLYFSGLTKQCVFKPASYLLRKADPITHILEDSHDVFHVSALGDAPSEWVRLLSLCRTQEHKPPVIELVYQSTINATEPIYPPRLLTPHFDLEEYFKQLVEKRNLEGDRGGWLSFGNGILYSEMVASTQSVIDKNSRFSQALPTGFVCLAANQVAGRGRGQNSWMSQAGALQFSLVVRHNVNIRHAPAVFIQYIVALAVVESIRKRAGYEDIPLRLKWPNDIYINTKSGELKEVGGQLINSTIVDDEFVLVISCGINLSNAESMVSINDIIKDHSPAASELSAEGFLAGILVKFEVYYNQFCEKGMGQWFLHKYCQNWLHEQ